MADRIKVFWCEPTDRERQWLRRYRSGDEKCAGPGGYGFCNAMFALGEADILYTSDGYIDGSRRKQLASAPRDDDPRWPTKCDACTRAFTNEDPKQLFTRQIYVRVDQPNIRFTLDDAPAGACWDAWWVHEHGRDGLIGCGWSIGPDHRSLVVVCPDGHQWMIDARASNCTMKGDNTHHCWVRHGKPEDGTLHVDKNGNTCAAGAGSIQTPKWHGFLHHGELHT